MSDIDIIYGFDEMLVEIWMDVVELDVLNNFISDCLILDNWKKDIFKELDEFFMGENEVGFEINLDLVKGFISVFYIWISEEKIKVFMKGYYWLMNCDNWIFFKINEFVWFFLKKKF